MRRQPRTIQVAPDGNDEGDGFSRPIRYGRVGKDGSLDDLRNGRIAQQLRHQLRPL
jgi:hypothetical protein